MKSLGAMIKKLHGMVGTADLTEWETDFVQHVFDQSGEGEDTTYLSTKQVEIVNRLYQKHFSDADHG